MFFTCLPDLDEKERGVVYGAAAVSVCSVVSLLGVPLVLMDRNSVAVQLILQGLIGMAVSSMAGDAVLHLWPQAMGIHGHHKEGSGHRETSHNFTEDAHGAEEENDIGHLWVSLALLGTLYLFFVFETVMHMHIENRHDDSAPVVDTGREVEVRKMSVAMTRILTHLKPSPRPSFADVSFTGSDIRPMSFSRPRWSIRPEISVTGPSPRNSFALQVPSFENHPNLKAPSPRRKIAKRKANGLVKVDAEKKFGIPIDKIPMVLMITVGDMFHNFTDGLALGAAFPHGTMVGVSTSIAVFCHELPHELGDVAILYDCGLSMSRVVLLNFIAALTGYLGLLLGVLISSIQGAYEWIFAVTAGMFIYIAFIDMLPQMMHVKTRFPALVFAVQNLGMLLGVAAMVLLALNE